MYPQGELESLLSNLFFFLGELTKHVKIPTMAAMSRYAWVLGSA